MPCRGRNDNRYNIGCGNKHFVIRTVKHKNEFMFRMQLHHPAYYFFCIMAIPFETVFLQENSIYGNAHKRKSSSKIFKNC